LALFHLSHSWQFFICSSGDSICSFILQFLLEAPVQHQQLQVSENLTDFSESMGLDAGAVLPLSQNVLVVYLIAKMENMAIPCGFEYSFVLPPSQVSNGLT